MFYIKSGNEYMQGLDIENENHDEQFLILSQCFHLYFIINISFNGDFSCFCQYMLSQSSTADLLYTCWKGLNPRLGDLASFLMPPG